MSGRAALVTGGGGGIGEATARLFAEEGGAVALVDVDGPAVEAAAAGIAAAVPGARVLPLVADVAQEGETARAVAEAVAQLGALDALVNVAGIRLYTPLAEADGWQRILGVNVLATAHCCRVALPHLRVAGGASIVNVSSVYGVMGRRGMGQYDTTKAAVSTIPDPPEDGRGGTGRETSEAGARCSARAAQPRGMRVRPGRRPRKLPLTAPSTTRSWPLT